MTFCALQLQYWFECTFSHMLFCFLMINPLLFLLCPFFCESSVGLSVTYDIWKLNFWVPDKYFLLLCIHCTVLVCVVLLLVTLKTKMELILLKLLAPFRPKIICPEVFWDKILFSNRCLWSWADSRLLQLPVCSLENIFFSFFLENLCILKEIAPKWALLPLRRIWRFYKQKIVFLVLSVGCWNVKRNKMLKYFPVTTWGHLLM